MKKVLTFSIFFTLIFTSIFALENKPKTKVIGCTGELSELFIANQEQISIKLIEIDTKNYRKWTVNGIRILTSRYRYVEDKYKKRFDATVSITYGDNTKCTFNARIRHSGDEKDHISLLGNSITQSLDIHLSNGNIRGITKFKLLRPKVRGILEDEVFLTEILRNLDYIAPRTIKVTARVNRIKSTMLFQEKAAKEMLEFNNRREGPIFEGDERFFFNKVDKLEDNQISGWSIGVVDLMNNNAKHMLAKQVNSNLVNKSQGHKQMSLDSTSKLNLIYLYFASRFQDKLNSFNYMEYDFDNNLLALSDQKNTLRLDEYNLLIQAVNGHHGLAVNNRKFFWNSIENYFEPINYDSNANISLNVAPGAVRLPISNQFFEAFESLKEKIRKLEHEYLQTNLRLSGLDINKDKIKIKINQIIKNINQLEKNYIDLDKKLVEHNKFEVKEDILDNYKNNLEKSKLDIILVNFNSKNNKFKKCLNFLENCQFIEIDNDNLSDLLEGNLHVNKKPYQYLGKYFNFDNFFNNNFNNSKSVGNTKIFYDNGIEIDYDKINNRIDILQKIPGAKVNFLKGELNNLEIFFKGIEIEKNKISSKNFPTDINGLTGCVTFSNLVLNNVSIEALGSSCEDTVNLINVTGTINKLLIKNSYSDALDIDFSNVKIKSINVSNAGNDCVDLSSGKYYLANIELQQCGDKALSIGEKSFVQVDRAIVRNADIGIASKDSSLTIIKENLLENLKTCVSVYNKKQEFDGAIIKMDHLNCKNYQKKINFDSRSIITKKIKNINN